MVASDSACPFGARVDSLTGKLAREICEEYDQRVYHLEVCISRLKSELAGFQCVDPAFEDLGCGQPALQKSLNLDPPLLKDGKRRSSHRQSLTEPMPAAAARRRSLESISGMSDFDNPSRSCSSGRLAPSRRLAPLQQPRPQDRMEQPQDAEMSVGFQQSSCVLHDVVEDAKPPPPLALKDVVPCGSVAEESIGQSATCDEKPIVKSIEFESEDNKSDNLDTASSGLEEPDVFVMRAHWKLEKREYDSIVRRAESCTPGTQTIDFADPSQFIEVKQHRLNPCVIHPQSYFRLFWDVLAMVLLMYDMITIPMLVFDLPEGGFLGVMNGLTLSYWSFDILVSLFTGVFVDGVLATDFRTIWRTYTRSWFVFDVFVLLPEFILLSGVGTDADGTKSVGLARAARTMRYTKYIRLVRLLRVFKSDKMFRDLQTRINNNFVLLILSLLRLAVNIVVMVHLLACAWYALGEGEANGWVHREGLLNMSLGNRYLYSFQWSMARVHPSTFGNFLNLETVQERIFGIMVSLVAICGGGVLVSCITNKMAQLQAFRQQRVRKLWVIREYMRGHPISGKLSARVKKYIEKSLNRKLMEQYAHEMQQMLPKGLLVDVHFEVWSPYINVSMFFSALCSKHSRAVWWLCHSAMLEVPVLEFDRIFTTWDKANRMLFVMQGAFLYTLGEHGEAPGESRECAKPGITVAEPVLWTAWLHQGEFIALGDSLLLSLSASEFNMIMVEYERALPEAHDRARCIVQWLNSSESVPSDLLPPYLIKIEAPPPTSIFPWASRPSISSQTST
eukprot:TRINITY_DN55422_c0_g1_i1.p1 TRINITY_DN55422_c0_g1~~TRINITY_DN55422_c0_g1_i1.p1  ORF type:complete len:789 (+),score=99.47 TRINITY_DN55422_c0_g1_i1:54-2420(+)